MQINVIKFMLAIIQVYPLMEFLVKVHEHATYDLIKEN